MDFDRRSFGRAAFLGAASVAAAAVTAGVANAQEDTGESTFDRIQRTKTLRVAALPGEAPYFNKDLATGAWTGMCVEMAKDIAATFDAQIEWFDSTYGNSVIELQTGKVDLAFSLTPTPKRALAIGFSRPVFMHGFGAVCKKGFEPTRWAELDKPEVRVAVDIGSGHELAARNFAPNATITPLKTRDDCILAVQTGRADCSILTVVLGLTAVKRNPALGKFSVLTEPLVALPNCMGVRYEADKRWRDFLDNWTDYNRGAGQIRKWMIDGLALNGVVSSDIPSNVTF